MNQNSGGTISPAVPERWTILTLIEWASAFLVERGFDEARLHVELMLAHVLGLARLGLYLQFDRPLTKDELAAFRALFERRLKHEPLQYILGETEFMGLKFFVDPSVLIPRPETELLVERAVDIARQREGPLRVLDIGTGSGNIAVSIGHFVPHASVAAIDASRGALDTAARNVALHGITNVKLQHADVFSEFLPGETFDMIVANPPYVSQEEFQALAPEVKDFEPASAVTDGGDGLRVVRRISEVAAARLAPDGTILMEIGYGQAGAVHAAASEAGLSSITFLNDLAGIPRVLSARGPSAGGQEQLP